MIYWYLKSNTLSLADIFENFTRMCLKSYELHPIRVFSVPGLA